MNKLFTKISSAIVGIAMAIGVGVAIGSNRDVRVAEATTGNRTLFQKITAVGDLEAGKSYLIAGAEANGKIKTMATTSNTNNRPTVELTVKDNKVMRGSNAMSVTLGGTTGAWTFSADNYAGSGTFLGQGNQTSSNYLKIYDDVGDGAKGDTWTISFSDGAAVITSTKKSSRNIIRINNSGSPITCYSSGQSPVYLWKECGEAPITPTISAVENICVPISGNTTLQVTYDDFEQSADITATSNHPEFATVTASVNAAAGNGTVDFTVNGVAAGSAVITLASQGATPINVNVDVYQPVGFTKISKTAKIVSGSQYLIAEHGTNYVMSAPSGNGNNRTSTTATLEGSTMTTANSLAAVLTITKGTEEGYEDYYTISDNNGYLYCSSNNDLNNNYLKTTAALYGDNEVAQDTYWWSISFESDYALIFNKDAQSNQRNIKFNPSNGQKIFNSYKNTQNNVDLYELTSTIPADVPFTNITAEDYAVGEGSSTTYTFSYLPVNANIDLTVTADPAEKLAIGSVSIDNGVGTIRITGGAVESDTQVTLTISDGGSINDTAVITVKDYVKDHSLVTAKTALVNGTKVILAPIKADGDPDVYNVSAGVHAGNNYGVVSTAFAPDKSSLAADANSTELTVWCIDQENQKYVLSDGQYFLASATSKNNYLQRVDTLNERCYFTITDDANGVIVSNTYGKDHGWTKKVAEEDVSVDDYVLKYNHSNRLISLYDSVANASYSNVSLYSQDGQVVNPIQGFVEVFLHMGLQKTNYFEVLKTNYAKLTAEQKAVLCTEQAYASALARIQEIAAAASYKLDTSTKEFVPVLASISVEGQSASLVVGANFVFGGTVTATYGDESTKVVDNANVTVTGYDMSQAGTQEVTVSYTEDGVTKTTTYPLNVLDAEVESVVVTKNPTKTTYYVGDSIDPKGLEVTVTLTNGKTTVITSGFEFSGFDSSKPVDSQTVTVTVGGQTATFTVKILAVAVSKVEIKKAPTKVSYFVGDKLDTTGLVVKATKNNGVTEDITTGFTISGFDSSKPADSQTVTVTYEGKSATFTVKIVAVVVTIIAIKTNPTKTTYEIGEELDTTGLVITVTKNNGATEDITTGFTVSGFNSSTAAESQTVTVTYEGKTATFTVKINGPVADELTTAKANAIGELETLVRGLTQADYSEANWTLIQEALAEARTAINACESVDEVNAALTRIKAAINAVKTIAQQASDDASALAAAKESALAALTEYYNSFNQDNYDETGLAALAAAYLDGQNAINAANDTDAVASALTAAKAALDAVETKPAAPAKKRCGGDIAATSIILSALALAGAGLLVFKKRKED